MAQDIEIPRFFGSEIYRGSSYGAWHPLRVPRVSTVMDLSRALGWLPSAQYLISPRAKPSALNIWHSEEYIDALYKAEAAQSVNEEIKKRHALGTPSNPVFTEMYRRPATGAGASLMTGSLLKNGGVVFHPGGGTHHGMPDRANGFCYLNDPVLAILSLKAQGLAPIVYLDIDAHHPDGVEHAFAADPDVVLISTHEENRWPRTGHIEDQGIGNVYNLPLPSGLNDSEFAHIREHLLRPLIEGIKPQALVMQCGADSVLEDPQSRLALSNNAYFDTLRRLMPIAPRLLVMGGGGYNPWTVGRLWTGLWAVLNGHDLPEVLPVSASHIMRELCWENAPRSRVPAPHLFTTLQDKPRPGPVCREIEERVAHLVQRPLVKA